MKKNRKRKNYDIGEREIPGVCAMLAVKSAIEPINRTVNLVVFRKDILQSLEKVAGKGGVDKIF